MTQISLASKVALITGAGRGLGRAYALAEDRRQLAGVCSTDALYEPSDGIDDVVHWRDLLAGNEPQPG